MGYEAHKKEEKEIMWPCLRCGVAISAFSSRYIFASLICDGCRELLEKKGSGLE